MTPTDSRSDVVRLAAPAALLPRARRVLRRPARTMSPTATEGRPWQSRVGETVLELRAAGGLAVLPLRFPRPGRPLRGRARLGARPRRALPDPETGEEVFDFTNWDAKAVYFHDPAGSIVELIAHRGVGEAARRARSRRPSCSASPRSASSAIRRRSRRRSNASSGSRSGTAPSRERGGSRSSARRRGR